MTIQEEFAAAATERAEQINVSRAATTHTPQQTAGALAADWLKGQFEAIDADRGKEQQQPAPELDSTDVFNHIPKF